MSTQADSESSIGRRRFLQGVGATTAIGVGLASTGTPAAAFDWDDLVNSDTAKLVGATALAGPVGLGWALRDVGVLGSDAPPEGLTADALEQDSYQAARTRLSVNKSTLIDNKNILTGAENAAYIEGKTAAIEAMNDQLSEAEVQDAATAAVDEHASTIQRNLLKSWNESLRELETIYNTASSHADVTADSLVSQSGIEWGGYDSGYGPHTLDSTGFDTRTDYHTLPNGEPMDIIFLTSRWVEDGFSDGTAEYSPLEFNWSLGGSHGSIGIKDYENARATVTYDGSTVGYLPWSGWGSIFDAVQSTFNSVRDSVITWVGNAYGQVQSGEIDISDLITPSDRAAMMADEESEAQAIADLAALNIPVDVEREATVTIEETGATLRGTLAITDESDGPITAGTTYTPSNLNGDVYLTFDASLLEGDWSAYETGVDGGNMTLTDEPYPGTVYRVETTANETVTINSTDWTSNESGGWYYDAGEDLDTGITEIASVDYFAQNEQPQFETIKLDSEFTVETFTNTETGEEEGQASFSSSEPQDDTNYITQEEWNELEQQNEELIQKYEESQDTGGGGITLPGFGDVEGLGAIAGGVAVVGGVVLVLKQVADFYLPG